MDWSKVADYLGKQGKFAEQRALTQDNATDVRRWATLADLYYTLSLALLNGLAPDNWPPGERPYLTAEETEEKLRALED